jgi:hypothetical protein
VATFENKKRDKRAGKWIDIEFVPAIFSYKWTPQQFLDLK